MKNICSIYYDDEVGKYFIKNESTNETTELGSVKVSKKKEVEGDPIPKLTLLENKYVLNNTAILVMGIKNEDKLEIRYEQSGFSETPIIGKNSAFGTEAGNRLSKSNSVSFRGIQHAHLSEYGDVFELVKHPIKENIFILKSNKNKSIELPPDVAEEIELPDDVDFDLDNLDDEETDTEVSSSIFDFTL